MGEVYIRSDGYIEIMSTEGRDSGDVEVLRALHDEKQKALEDALAHISTQRAEIEDLEARLELGADFANGLEEDLEKQDKDIEALRTRMEEQDGTISIYRKMMVGLESDKAQLEVALEEEQEYTQQLKAENEGKRNLVKEIRTAKDRIDFLTQKNLTLQQEAQVLIEEKSKLAITVDSLRVCSNSAREAYEKTEDELKKSECMRLTQKEAIIEQNAKLAACKLEKEDLEARLELQVAMTVEVQENEDHLEKALKSRTEEVDRNRKIIQQQNENIAQQAKRIRYLEEQWDIAKGSNDDLAGRLNTSYGNLKKSRLFAEDLEVQLADAKRVIKQEQSESDRLEKAHSEALRSANAYADTLAEKIKEIAELRENLEGTNEHIRDILAANDDRLARLSETISAQVTTIKGLKKARDAAKADRDNAALKGAKEVARRHKVQQELVDADTAIAVYKKENCAQHEEIGRLRAELKVTRDALHPYVEMEKHGQDAESLELELYKEKDLHKKAKKDLEECYESLANLHDHVRTLQDNLKDAEKAIEIYRKENALQAEELNRRINETTKGYRDEIEDLDSMLLTRDNEISKNLKEIKELKESITFLQAALSKCQEVNTAISTKSLMEEKRLLARIEARDEEIRRLNDELTEYENGVTVSRLKSQLASDNLTIDRYHQKIEALRAQIGRLYKEAQEPA